MPMDIKGIVRELVTTHNTNEPFELCKCLDIMISFESLGRLLGYCDCHFRMWTIHINDNVPYHLQRFVCAHELGHALLHQDANVPFLRAHTFYCTNKLERQANAFAVELLLPDELIMDHDCTSLCNLAKAVGVPHGLEELKDTGRINFHG